MTAETVMSARLHLNRFGPPGPTDMLAIYGVTVAAVAGLIVNEADGREGDGCVGRRASRRSRRGHRRAPGRVTKRPLRLADLHPG